MLPGLMLPGLMLSGSVRHVRYYVRVFLLVVAVVLFMLPLYGALVVASNSMSAMLVSPPPMFLGKDFFENFWNLLKDQSFTYFPFLRAMFNSLVMASSIAVGKIALSFISAFAIVYFRFPLRSLCFALIFSTMMLPVEVRIVPTFQIVASLGLLDSYGGLVLPLLASATGTFLFRQVFQSIPVEMVEAAKMDGAGPIKFMRDILWPMSRTNVAALFIIMFIYGWNQYLWPLLMTNSDEMMTLVIGIKKMLMAESGGVHWPMVMCATLVTILPPSLIIILMQRLFIKGLVDAEK